MSQHDFNIANQTFPSFRSDLNDALVAAATMSAGASAPTTPYAYQLWFDTTTGTWKVRNSGNTAWISTITTDLATGNVGIGTSSPNVKTEVGGTDAAVSLRVNTQNAGVSASNYSQIQLSDNDVVRAYWRNVRDGSGATQFAYNGYLAFLSDGGGTPTERMRIDSSGNVGIGTSSPNYKLQVHDSGSTTIIQLSNGTSGSAATDGFQLTSYLNEARFVHREAGPMIFFTDSAERMRIDSNGRMLVGDTTNVGTADHKVSIQKGTSGRCLGLGTTLTSATIMMSLVNGNGTVGSIQTNGTSTSYVTSSDYRLKENVVADWDATTRLKQLNPVRFNFIADADTTVDGFLAHEVQDVVPEAISGTKDGMRDEEYQVSAATGDIYTPAIEAVLDEDGVEVTPAVAEVIHSTDVERSEELAEGQQWRETTAAVMGTRSVPDYQGIDQSKLVPLLVKTIQELEARIAALEAN